jgi:hypothetical protein
MPYQVDRFNGTFLTSVADGTIDTTTDIRFVGKNYAGYGEVQNENFLHLLENFANTTQPPKVVTGQIWYDSGEKRLKFYDGSKFRIASGAEASATAPAGLAIGDFWWDTSANQLYTWSGSDYVLVGPESNPDLGASGVIPQIVKDVSGTNHSILKFQSGGDTLVILSKDEFTLNSTLNPIAGFTTIKKGYNLINTSTTGVTSSDHYYWGTSSNSIKLGGFVADDFVRKGSILFDQRVDFNDPGFRLGDQKDLSVKVENGDQVVFETDNGGGTFNFRVKVTSSEVKTPLIIAPNGIIPGANNTYSLGATGEAWLSVTATTFLGTLIGNVTGNVVGIHKGNITANDDSTVFNANTKIVTADFQGTLTGNVIGDVTGTSTNTLTLNGLTGNVSSSGSTVAIRDSSGQLFATAFKGNSDSTDRLKIDNTAVDTGATYFSAKTTASGNTIAARDPAGNLFAVLFDGTATAARYADLAEKYLPDAEYEVGTVMMIGGDKEVTASKWGKRAIGVISSNPAFMMNKDLEGGVYVALKGRVPVKVIGRIRKGDNLIAADNGYAVMAVPHASGVFAVALESSDDEGVKVIEALVI